jgi:predicted acetyltransferase
MLETRPLSEADLDAASSLGQLAFGYTERRDPAVAPRLPAGVNRWGAFDEQGRLVAAASDIEHEQWWGGRILSSSGVASVAVQAEQRGRGAGRTVMTALLHGARERGAVVATLFATSTGVYRSLGFEACGALRRCHLPTDALPDRGAGSVSLRPATGRDWAEVRGIYDAVAGSGNGMLTRRGPLFADPTGDELPSGLDGVTLAVYPDGQPVGYASWIRGKGYRDDSLIVVPDCLAVTVDAADALLSMLRGWRSVAPTLRLRLPPWTDAVTSRLPVERLREHQVDVWMHRPLDVVAATEARGWPHVATGSVEFRLVDPLLPGNDGAWRLTVEQGSAVLERASGEPDLVLSVRGWSLLWCGSGRTAQLRQAGLLEGPAADDARLDALLAGGGPSGLLDYF